MKKQFLLYPSCLPSWAAKPRRKPAGGGNMKKQIILSVLLVLALVFGLSFVSCNLILPGSNSGDNPGSNPGSNPGNGVAPTPSLALRAEPVAASTSTPLGSYTDGSKNYYLIDVGYIRNTYVSDVVAPIHYNGMTPMSLSKTTVTEFTIAEAMKSTITNSVTVSDTQSSKDSIDVAWKNKIGVGGSGTEFSVGLKLEWSGSWTNSNTTTKSTETSVTETIRQSESVSISFTIGNNGEPAGYYRYALYSVSDVYFILSTSLDNQELLSWDTVVCARGASFLPHWDYEVDGNFDNSPAGSDITFTEDFYKTLSKPSSTVPGNVIKQTQEFDLTKSANSPFILADTDIAIIIGDSSKTYSNLEIIVAKRSTPLTIELQNVRAVGRNGNSSAYVAGTHGSPLIFMGSDMARVPNLILVSSGNMNELYGGNGGNGGAWDRTGQAGGNGGSAILAGKITISGDANIVLKGGNGGKGGDGVPNGWGHCDGGNGGNGGAAVNADDITINLQGLVYALRSSGGGKGNSGPVGGTPGKIGSGSVPFTSTPHVSSDSMVRYQL